MHYLALLYALLVAVAVISFARPEVKRKKRGYHELHVHGVPGHRVAAIWHDESDMAAAVYAAYDTAARLIEEESNKQCEGV